MKIKHIKSGLSVFAFACATHFTVGCSCLNKNLNMYRQKDQKSAGITGQENQENNASESSKKLFFFDFKCFFEEKSLGLYLGNECSYFECSPEGNKIVGTFIMEQGKILPYKYSVSPHASINDKYDKKLVEDKTKSLLAVPGKLRDPAKFKNLIVHCLNEGHKVAISACTYYPHAVTATLQHIGLNENQIKDICILFSELNLYCDDARNGLSDKILKQNMDAALKLTEINKENIRYIPYKKGIDWNKIRELAELGS